MRVLKVGLAGVFVCGLLFSRYNAIVRAQDQGNATIITPTSGASVRAVVTIRGAANHPAFQRYELAFAYDPDPTGTWFSIQDPVATPVIDGILGLWDTTEIADGNYALRLRVYTGERTFVDSIVRNVRVENVAATPTPEPTATPAPTAPPASGPTVTAIVLLTPNPAAAQATAQPSLLATTLTTLFESAQLEAAFWDGVRLTLVVFGILGVYTGIRVGVRFIWREGSKRKS
jgi:hypothetical protein